MLIISLNTNVSLFFKCRYFLFNTDILFAEIMVHCYSFAGQEHMSKEVYVYLRSQSPSERVRCIKDSNAAPASKHQLQKLFGDQEILGLLDNLTRFPGLFKVEGFNVSQLHLIFALKPVSIWSSLFARVLTVYISMR